MYWRINKSYHICRYDKPHNCKISKNERPYLQYVAGGARPCAQFRERRSVLLCLNICCLRYRAGVCVSTVSFICWWHARGAFGHNSGTDSIKNNDNVVILWYICFNLRHFTLNRAKSLHYTFFIIKNLYIRHHLGEWISFVNRTKFQKNKQLLIKINISMILV